MRAAFVALLLSQVGQHEGRDADGTWNNRQRYSRETPGLEWSDGQPWCAVFEAWAAHQCGMDRVWPMTASCLTAVEWWQDAGRWSPYPVLGGPFYIGPGGGTHTGVVVAYDATTITTVEGNSNPGGSPNGDGVYKRTRLRSSIYGYGVPRFAEPTVSADPHLDGRTAASYDQFPEDDMPLTSTDLDAIEQRVWGHAENNPDTGQPVYMSAVMAWTDHRHNVLYSQLAGLTATVKTLAGLVGEGVDTDAVIAAVQQAIAGAALTVHVDVNGKPLEGLLPKAGA